MTQAALIAIMIMSALAAGAEAEESVPPFLTMRRLLDIQDRSATTGHLSKAATDAAASTLIEAIRGKNVDWTDHRNSGAVVLYLLTGGDPQAIRSTIETLPDNAAHRQAMQVSLDYAEGDKKRAQRLALLDTRSLPPDTAGAVSLAQARQLFDQDAPKSLEKLRESRILAPGGLVEEASLRLELFLLDHTSGPLRIGAIAQRYLTRFSNSAYAGNFRERLESLVEESWTRTDRSGRDALIEALADVPSDARRRLLLRLARSSILRGEAMESARLVNEVCQQPEPDSEIGERCSLYRRLASLFEGAGPALRAAYSVGGHLAAEDRILLECTKSLLEPKQGAADDEGNSESRQDDEKSAMLTRVAEEIQEASKLLSRRN